MILDGDDAVRAGGGWVDRAVREAFLPEGSVAVGGRGAGAAASLPPLSRVALAATAGIAVTAAVIGQRVHGVIGEVPPLVPVFGVSALLVAGAIANRRRWAPFLAAGVSAVMLAMTLPWLPELMATPADVLFAPFVVAAAFGFVALAAGVAAGVQNYRSRAHGPLPRWMLGELAAVAGVVAGIFTMAAVPRPDSAAGVSDEMLARLPALETEKFDFVQPELRVRAGETVVLRLVNKDGATHSFDVDELDVHTPMPANGTAVAVFKAEGPGTYVFYCAPHYDRTTGEGMKGVLIVEE
jgi:plastocyanin